MRTLIIGVSLVLALGTQAGLALEYGDLSASNFIRACRMIQENRTFNTLPEAFEGGQCLGVILGVDLMAAIQSPRPFCRPETSDIQLVAVVVHYIDQHPEIMHLHFGKLVYDALKEAWPCKALIKP
jgi:hypothetical protein